MHRPQISAGLQGSRGSFPGFAGQPLPAGFSSPTSAAKGTPKPQGTPKLKFAPGSSSYAAAAPDSGAGSTKRRSGSGAEASTTRIARGSPSLVDGWLHRGPGASTAAGDGGVTSASSSCGGAQSATSRSYAALAGRKAVAKAARPFDSMSDAPPSGHRRSSDASCDMHTYGVAIEDSPYQSFYGSPSSPPTASGSAPKRSPGTSNLSTEAAVRMYINEYALQVETDQDGGVASEDPQPSTSRAQSADVANLLTTAAASSAAAGGGSPGRSSSRC